MTPEHTDHDDYWNPRSSEHRTDDASAQTRSHVTRAKSDWPGPGAIDLDVHDRPHASASIEWWYLNAHLQTSSGRAFSMFAAFFQLVKGHDERTKAPLHGHALTWAISDVEQTRYLSESRLDRDSPRIGLERIDGAKAKGDPRMRRALREVFERGSVPRPDLMFDADVRVSNDKLDLDYGAAHFHKLSDGHYELTLSGEEGACDLRFVMAKDPIRHGHDGVVPGLDGGDMFYYFIPRAAVRGTITVDGEEHAVTGDGWYDHEFGGHEINPDQLRTEDFLGLDDTAWTWTAAQLTDGSEITAYVVLERETNKCLDARALIVEADGTRHEYAEIELTSRAPWRSTRTFNAYPTHFHVSVPAAKLELDLVARFEDQEFPTLISQPAFWEGTCEVKGVRGERTIEGLGFVERSGFSDIETLDDFFAAVSKEVRRSVSELVPFEPPFERVRDLIASEERAHFMHGVDIPALEASMIRPLREIVDRGGKSWRSYAALACCDIVGGDSRDYVQWLAFPEMMHVGSLIVDDVQDKSEIRRGGKTCHLIYGEPIAINTGTAAYFMGHKLLRNKRLKDTDLLRLYDLYFDALRAGHAGQALDLYGLDAAMEDAVESGEGAMLEDRVLAIHRLKTAAPAAAMARMGAIAGNGSEVQIEALGQYFESLGLAFQIMDDVLNLRGFEGDLKQRGEDISRGIITLPTAKGISRLNLEQRRTFWSGLQQKSAEVERVSTLIETLEVCGAIEACAIEARELVEAAWTELSPVVEDSLPKIMLRAFGWYVLDRHY